jgi:hypothetical protein
MLLLVGWYVEEGCVRGKNDGSVGKLYGDAVKIGGCFVDAWAVDAQNMACASEVGIGGGVF